MNDSSAVLEVVPSSVHAEGLAPSEDDKAKAVSTHVLVEEDKVVKLRELSKKTRVAQSEYLREAVDDLLTKYGRDDEGV